MEVRLSSYVFITKIEPKEIFDTPSILGQIPAISLDILAKNYGANSKIYVSDLRETMNIINNPVANYTTALVEKIPSPTKYDKDRLKPTALAVFDHDQLKGYLDLEEGQGFNIITNKYQNGLMVFESNQSRDKFTIEVLSSKVKITPRYENDKVGFDIELKLKGNIAERITQVHKPHSLDIEAAQAQLNQVLVDKLRKTIHTAQKKYRIDFFNLSKDFNRKYPQVFKLLKDEWNDVFSTADINIKVESTILHSALSLNKGAI